MLNQLTKFFIAFITLFIPVKRGLFLYGSWFGNKYGDNSRYFFEHVSREHPEIESIWITKNQGVLEQINNQTGLKAVEQGSFKSLWLHLRAQAVFCNTSQESDLWGLVLNRSTVVFNLWHGTPIKKIGLDALDSNISKEKLGVSSRTTLKALLPKSIFLRMKRFANKETYFLASSEAVSTILQSAMGIDKEHVIIGGYPKLDHLIKAPTSLSSGKILYAPTYRGEYNSENDLLSEFGFDPVKVNSWLSEHDKTLTIRLHPANALPQEKLVELKNFPKIIVGDNRDLYESLKDYELVVTDFSSLYYDCLAINVPVLLAPFGLESYEKNDRPLYFSPSELYPYPLANDWPQLITELAELLEQGKDLSDIKRKFYLDSKGNSSRELMKTINGILLG
ncbi:CDP-glycerol glycerophosphotransferase family protein [Thalassotalea euphylliae]|uniref:CDP-glycerol glycerophosphotransferase family protein n=1 Tax=Thalassotalea euphylliae TaxID=1655234 RepID=UPI0015F25ED9|nr:CDP-glycerol glycerophosphotransferase family protein [Thalassotalea euphylliae]